MHVYVAKKKRDNTRSRQRQGIDIMLIANGKRISVKTVRPDERLTAEYLLNGIGYVMTGKKARLKIREKRKMRNSENRTNASILNEDK